MIENEYGRALRELGIPGTALFIWLLITALRGSFSAYRKVHTPRYHMLAGACIGIQFSIVLQLAVGSALYLAPGGLVFWLFYALALRLPELEAQEYPGLEAGPGAVGAAAALRAGATS